jgi:hypothetical protein
LENIQTRFGKLTLNYISDENNYHCECDCGTKVILTKEQLDRADSCGCEKRKYWLSLNGMSDDGYTAINQNHTVKYSENRGVNFDKRKNKWRVRITYRSKEYHLGYFAEKEDALKRRQEAERSLNSNFIEWYNSVCKKDSLGMEG